MPHGFEYMTKLGMHLGKVFRGLSMVQEDLYRYYDNPAKDERIDRSELRQSTPEEDQW